MAVVTVRPDQNVSGATSFTITGGSPSVHAALSDNSDSTYVRKSTSVSGTASLITGFGTTTIAASQTVRRVRLRARIQTPNSNGKLNLQLGTRVSGVNYFTPALAVRGQVATGEVVGPWYSTAPDGGPWTQTKIDAVRVQTTEFRDSSDRAFVYELYVDVDVANQATVTVSAPTGTITATAKPDVTWSVSDSDGDTASSFQVKVFNSTAYGAGSFNPTTSTATWDSGQVASSDVSTSVGVYLSNATYRAYVRTAKTINGSPFWSGWAYSQFTVNLTAPTVPTLTVTWNANTNSVAVTMTGATASPTFTSQTYDLERTTTGGGTWTPVRDGTNRAPDGSFVVTLTDYDAARAATVGYRCRSVGYVGDNVIASAWSATSNASTTNDGTWWLKAVDDPTLNRGTVSVLADLDLNVEEQIGVFRPLGRTRPVVLSQALGGEDGTYDIITKGDAEHDAVWALVTHQGTLLVQDPFGDQKYVRIVRRSKTKSGGTGNPIHRIAVDYVEVDDN